MMTRGTRADIRRAAHLVAGALILLVSLGGTHASAEAKAGDPQLVSRASGAKGEQANRAADAPAVSRNGRFVAFVTQATNLVPDDRDTLPDVYVRDRKRNRTVLVSRARGADGEKGNGVAPSISADGRFVAFAGASDELVAEPMPENTVQIYVRDLEAKTTTLVSRATGVAGTIGDDHSDGPSISGDGRFVAFESDATNLDPAATTGTLQIYVRDLATNATILGSRASGETGAPGGPNSDGPAISADGTAVAFNSLANFGPAFHEFFQVYVRDLPSATTTLASQRSGPTGGPVNESSGPAISGNGARIAFTSDTQLSHTDLNNGFGIYVRDLTTSRTILASRDFGSPADDQDGAPGRDQRFPKGASISESGRYVAYASGGTASDRAGTGMFVRDLKKRETEHVRGTPGAGSPNSLLGRISGDGRWIAFQSNAARYPGGKRDRILQVFASQLRN